MQVHRSSSDQCWHPHLHILLDGEYIEQGKMSDLWDLVTYGSPIVYIKAVHDPDMAEEAIKEGISSILCVPIMPHGRLVGALRVYTSEPWEFTLEDVNFVQALAQIAAMAIEMSRLYQGQKEVIGILKRMREAQAKKIRTKR